MFRASIDGRANALFAHAILRVYVTVSTASPGWQQVLGRYRVGAVVIEPTTPLAQALALDRHWREAYRDQPAVVFARR